MKDFKNNIDPILSILLLISIVLPLTPIQSQVIHDHSGGEGNAIRQEIECISDEERKKVNEIINQNIKKFNIKNKKSSMIVPYEWPIQQNPSFDYNSTYAISNYVDHNPSYPNQLSDYNCGTHTYDTNNGYNHQGIDIYLWPFDHNQVNDNQTYAVAAAAGNIIAKQDGNADDNCALGNLPANYVIIEHSDGSRSWYWHLKQNSVTTKNIGSSVVSGEYLGVVASSGNSTGPHLHFECYDSNLNLVDPYAGQCNNMNSNTFWSNQKPYWEPTINTLLTHNQPPSFQACPNLDITNIESNFVQGQLVYFAAYYHDQLTSSNSNYQILNPNGTVYSTWNHTPPNSYRSSYWYWSITLPTNAPTGTWSWNVTLDGVTVSRDFEVFTNNLTCSSAENISSCISYTTPTLNQGNGANNSGATHSCWYHYTPNFTGTIDIYSCNEGVDTRLWVYSGGCNGLNQIANADDECTLFPGGSTYATEILGVPVTSGIPIIIEWDDRWSPNSFEFYIDCNLPSCPLDYAGNNQLSGTQNTIADYETDGLIQSNQIIDANVDYDSGTAIELMQGFEVKIGKLFNAFIDGCGNLLRSEDTTTNK